MNKKLAICVPFRNRFQHLEKFVPHMTNFLSERGIDFKIFICNQVDDKPFNRGKTKNIAFDIARKEGYDYFAFHDIDLLPEDSSCDYSYPDDNPRHLAFHLTDYGFDITYQDTFGGVVLFTKDQFEKVNGYYNEYWGWGAEDDDLFFRCKKHGHSVKTVIRMEKKGNKVASFNGENSFLEIKASDSINSALNNNYTISFLIKKHKRKDTDIHLSRDPNSELKYTPIMSKGYLLSFGCTNGGTFEFEAHSKDDGHAMGWLIREDDLWSYITVSVNRETGEMRTYLNGTELTNGESPKAVDLSNNIFGSESLAIGSFGVEEMRKNTIDFFDGKISHISLYSEALSEDDIRKISLEGQEYLHNNLVMHLNFENIEDGKVIDQSQFENHAIINNVKIENEHINEIIKHNLPARVKGRYICLPHEREGIHEGGEFKKCDYAKENERILVDLVKGGKLDTNKHGINNLEYNIKEYKSIFDNHAIIDVEC